MIQKVNLFNYHVYQSEQYAQVNISESRNLFIGKALEWIEGKQSKPNNLINNELGKI